MESQSSLINGISIVIPNYNGVELFPKIIPPAQVAAKNTGLNYEIIVADDCSTDESVKLLQEQFVYVNILSNEINSGFSKTANKGINAATYNWILLLNSDVILEPDYFKPLLKYTSNKNIFGITGRIIGWDDDIIQEAARLPYLKGIKLKTFTNYLLTDESQMKNGLYSIYLSGSNMFLNKSIFQFIGGFNELFSPFYAEDTELCVRAWRLAYKCIYDHNAICRHRTSSTIKKSSTEKFVKIIHTRNRMLLHAIHLHGLSLMLWWVQFIGQLILKTLLFKQSYLQSCKLFIQNIKGIKQWRRYIAEKSIVKLSLQQVVKKIRLSVKEKSYKIFTS